jgi:hypothetical protein
VTVITASQRHSSKILVMKTARNALVAFVLLLSATNMCSAQSSQPDYTFVFFQRSSAHGNRSSSEVFEQVRDDVLSWLAVHHVEVVGDSFAGKTWSEDFVPLQTVQRIALDNHAASVLHVTVDRPVMSWVKITVRCYDASGNLLWQKDVSNSTAVAGSPALRKTLVKLHAVLEQHLNQPGLLVRGEQIP